MWNSGPLEALDDTELVQKYQVVTQTHLGSILCHLEPWELLLELDPTNRQHSSFLDRARLWPGRQVVNKSMIHIAQPISFNILNFPKTHYDDGSRQWWT